MNTNELPKLGTKVNYYRFEKGDGAKVKDKFKSGRGIVRSLHLNMDKRIMVQVADGEAVYNIDAVCVNCSDATKQSYKDMVVGVQAVADSSQKKAQAIVDEGTKAVEELYTATLGEPVTI